MTAPIAVPGADAAPEVTAEVVGRVGHLRLNRPQVINALNETMVTVLTDRLAAWTDDAAVTAVVLSGAGDRGFCSGGDIRAVREAVVAGDHRLAQHYWRAEYALDLMIADYPKPVVTIMDGVTMGGGVGLGGHAHHRLVTERTAVAMPETIIGFFPDVGAAFPLSRAPGETGTHLVMTGRTVTGADAIAVGLADAMIRSADTAAVVEALADGGSIEALRPLTVAPPPSELLAARSWIDPCYAGDDPSVVMDRLRRHPDPAAQSAADDLARRCPASVHIALAAIRRAAAMGTLAEVLEQDRLLTERLAPYSDLVEGVRAQLVDKDRAPRWRHPDLAAVDPAEISALFAP